jgi:ATP-dependent RNA helicase DDX5/DBP2
VKARRSRTKSRSRSRSRSYSRHRHASRGRSRSPVASHRYEKTDAVSGSAWHDSVHQGHKSSPRAHPANDNEDQSDHKDECQLERLDFDHSPSPPENNSASYSPVNGKASHSMSPIHQPEGDVKAVEASEKPDAVSPARSRKKRGDEEGVIDEDGEIAEDDPRASAAAQNGDGN